MPVSNSNITQWKTNGRTFHKHAVAIGLLQWCLCSSIIICVGASSSSYTPTHSTVNTDINNLSATDTTNDHTTNINSTPTTNINSTPTTDIYSTFTTNINSSSSTDIYSTPTKNIYSTPTTDMNNTHTTDINSTPTKNINSTPTTNIYTTPTTYINLTPATNIYSTPTTNIYTTPATDINSTPATSIYSTPTTDIYSTPTTDTNSTPTTDIDSTPTTDINSTPTTDINSTPATDINSTPTTDINSTPTTDINSTPTTDINSTPTTDINSTPTTDINSTPTTDINSTPTTDINSTPTTDINSTPTTDINSTPTTDINSTPTTDINSTPTTDINSTPTTDSTSTPRAEITSTPAKRDRPSSFPMPTENKDIALNLQVKLASGNFSDSLKNSSNPYYTDLACNVTRQLTELFNTSRDFVQINVTGFWQGSIGVNFTSYYQGISDFSSLRKSIWNLSSDDFNFTVLNQTLNESITNELKRMCETSDNCPKDYHCSFNTDNFDVLQPYCEHLCNQHACLPKAYCVVSESNQPTCKCGEDDDYVYSGDNCEVQTEKLTMSKDKIIGIAAGVGGGVILLLVVAIFIILLRQRQKKRSREDNIIDNASEQSFQSFKGPEEATLQPLSSPGYSATPGNGHSMYRLPEERAENPKFNPYLSLPSVQQPASRQQDFSQGFFSAPERTRESSRNIKAKTQQFQERVPNYGDPVQIPRFQFDPHGSDYARTDNKRSQSSVSKPTNTRRENQHGGPLRSPAEAQVYDYSNDMELMASGTAHPLNDTDLYDFSYENQANYYARHRNNRHEYDSPYVGNVKQQDGMNDPYSVKRRLV